MDLNNIIDFHDVHVEVDNKKVTSINRNLLNHVHTVCGSI